MRQGQFREISKDLHGAELSYAYILGVRVHDLEEAEQSMGCLREHFCMIEKRRGKSLTPMTGHVHTPAHSV